MSHSTDRAQRRKKIVHAWTDSKAAMLEWITKTVGQLPPGQKASDVKDMVESTSKLVRLLTDMGDQVIKRVEPAEREVVIERDLGRLGARLGVALKGEKDVFSLLKKNQDEVKDADAGDDSK